MALDEQGARRACIDALLTQTWERYRTALSDAERTQASLALQDYAPADVAWALQRHMAGMGLPERRRGPPSVAAVRKLLDPELRRRHAARHIASLVVAEAVAYEPQRAEASYARVGRDGRYVVDDLGGWARLHQLVQARGILDMVQATYDAVMIRLNVLAHQTTIARLRKMTAAVQPGPQSFGAKNVCGPMHG